MALLERWIISFASCTSIARKLTSLLFFTLFGFFFFLILFFNSIALPPSRNKTASQVIRKVLRHEGKSISLTHRGISQRDLAALRILCLFEACNSEHQDTKKDPTSNKSKPPSKASSYSIGLALRLKMISKENERRVVSFIGSKIEESLSDYPTSIEEDFALIKKIERDETGEHAIKCVKLRVEEKKILTANLQWARNH